MSLTTDRLTVLKYLADKDNRSNYIFIEYIIGPGPYRGNEHAERIIKSLVDDQLIEVKKGTGIDYKFKIYTAGRKNSPPKRFKSDDPYKGLEARITVQGLSALKKMDKTLKLNPQSEPIENPIKNILDAIVQLLPNSKTYVVFGKSFNISTISIIIGIIAITISFFILVVGIINLIRHF